ncbi:C45 family autoproteolytic acyltransferase/hydolase [Streptomyces sp. PT12]|uniref:C45 family autoproteolytic acyltransferase/hydolase n=1 Tax=Streptomyces sp. PT12 TaxID=1510197 RepID=UPI000DE20954|nr:C45 family peptidase [Streptomyces sp. PT12]RBM08957.1 acyl-coenzyme A--6-aminopenicillanic acid acyl-transferase [Streptomyces sp. PT12]
MSHSLIFHAVEVGDGSDGRWSGRLYGELPALIDRWATDEARTPEGAAAAREQFGAYMPELLPALDMFADQGGHQPGLVPLLAMIGLKSPFASCTQIGGVGGTLLRNYDWGLQDTEHLILSSTLLRPVIGKAEGLWGLLDGMNDAGLAVSLTFGGRLVQGPGLGIPMVVRYLLETCETIEQAMALLGHLPVATAQNLTLVDRERAVTVHLGPDIAPIVSTDASAANHQHCPVPAEQERGSRTQERLAAIRTVGAEGDPDAVVEALLRPPLYQTGYEDGLGTLYTAAYRPAEGRVTYHWPGEEPWGQSFGAFAPGSRKVVLGGRA